MRRKIIAGNWKMNKLPNEALDFITELEPLVKNSENEIVLCVPYIDLFYTLLNAQGTNIKIGAQNMHWEKEGAYTGEISSEMLKAIGVEYVIIGHSERRKYFNETDEDVNKKIIKALEVGLKPIVCVGETLEERENHKIAIKQAKPLYSDCLFSFFVSFFFLVLFFTECELPLFLIGISHKYCCFLFLLSFLALCG